MGIEKQFIKDSLIKHLVAKFLEEELDRAGFVDVDIQRTPMLTRVNLIVTNPGRVIGRKGKTIKDLTEELSKKFNIENPQISVSEAPNPALEPRLVAKKIAKLIETGKKPRVILHAALRDIMNAGALGGEITVAGKLAAKGGRAKALRGSAGYIPKAGEPTRLVKTAHVTAYPKPGAIGVRVSIVPPGTVFPDKEPAKEVEIPNIIKQAADIDEAQPQAFKSKTATTEPVEEQKQKGGGVFKPSKRKK
ncbi:MAG: 30S ribosomal protein S3 [Candidatus Micrarchaeota archaeon]|nr:30S ribosomal protein S3 [Candidatus Micrarchaeota archaeon]